MSPHWEIWQCHTVKGFNDAVSRETVTTGNFLFDIFFSSPGQSKSSILMGPRSLQRITVGNLKSHVSKLKISLIFYFFSLNVSMQTMQTFSSQGNAFLDRLLTAPFILAIN